MRCWLDKVYLSPLAHRFWKLTLQLYARYAKFLDEVHLNIPEEDYNDLNILFKSSNSNRAECKWIGMLLLLSLVPHLDFVSAQVLTKSPTPEVTKEPTRPLPSSASSTSSRTSVDEGGSESGSPASLSTKQLVYIAADIQKLQEQVHTQRKNVHIYYRLNVVFYIIQSVSFWEFYNGFPLYCFHTDSLSVFLLDIRGVRDGQTEVRSHRIQKFCYCGR